MTTSFGSLLSRDFIKILTDHSDMKKITTIEANIMFAENDVYSHLNEKMYLKYYLPEIVKKLIIVIK